MIRDLMPLWLRTLLKIDGASLTDDRWTWRHTCRFGREPRIQDDLRRYLASKRYRRLVRL